MGVFDKGEELEILEDEPELNVLLKEMLRLGASDLHMAHKKKITYRIDMRMKQVGPIITGEEIYEILLVALSTNQQTEFLEKGSIDFAYEMEGHRFRGSLAQKLGEPGCVIRQINSTIYSIDELGLPQILKEISDYNWGMVLITGPTGSGKTTSLAGIIDYVNENNEKHITTIEQPIEYKHPNKKCFITQREVPTDSPTFEQGVIDALRADPDVILVGEMRDLPTVSAAMTGAETGHLVFGTLHTNTAPASINRIVSIYPESEHNKTRGQLAASLRAIVAQRLFPNPKGGKTALFEIMVVNDEIREAIRLGKIQDIYPLMKKYKNEGNVLMEDQIREAKAKGILSERVKW